MSANLVAGQGNDDRADSGASNLMVTFAVHAGSKFLDLTSCHPFQNALSTLLAGDAGATLLLLL